MDLKQILAPSESHINVSDGYRFLFYDYHHWEWYFLFGSIIENWRKRTIKHPLKHNRVVPLNWALDIRTLVQLPGFQKENRPICRTWQKRRQWCKCPTSFSIPVSLSPPVPGWWRYMGGWETKPGLAKQLHIKRSPMELIMMHSRYSMMIHNVGHWYLHPLDQNILCFSPSSTFIRQTLIYLSNASSWANNSGKSPLIFPFTVHHSTLHAQPHGCTSNLNLAICLAGYLSVALLMHAECQGGIILVT